VFYTYIDNLNFTNFAHYEQLTTKSTNRRQLQCNRLLVLCERKNFAVTSDATNEFYEF